MRKRTTQDFELYRRIYEEAHGPIPRLPNGRAYDIHHIDGDRTNNDPSNLQALTPAEHRRIHMAQGDYSRPMPGASNPRARAVRCIQTGDVYATMAEAAQACGITYQTVWSYCTGRSTGKAVNASKYTFEYVL